MLSYLWVFVSILCYGLPCCAEESLPLTRPSSVCFGAEGGPALNQGHVLRCCGVFAVAQAAHICLSTDYPNQTISVTDYYLSTKMGTEEGRNEEGATLKQCLHTLITGRLLTSRSVISWALFGDYLTSNDSIIRPGQMNDMTYEQVVTDIEEWRLKSIEDLEPYIYSPEEMSCYRVTPLAYFSTRFAHQELSLTDLDSWRSLLAQRIPIVVASHAHRRPFQNAGFALGQRLDDPLVEDYWNYAVEQNPEKCTIDWPPTYKNLRETLFIKDGSHCFCICGYSQKNKTFLVKNSWGECFGQRGYVWVSENYILAHSMEAHAIFAVDEPQG